MVNPIVQVNVTVLQAGTPNNLQKQGALLSQGGTTLAAGTTSFLTQASDLTALIKPAAALTSLTWLANVVTATTTVNHGLANGLTFPVVIAGATPSAYNGTFIATVTGVNTFTYPLTPDPGAETVPGTWQPESAIELQVMAATFFDQGSQQGVYVLELGPTTVTQAVTALGNFITDTPEFFYGYLVPRSWDADSSFLTFLAGFETPTSKTYFWVTTTLATRGSYTAAMKCVFAFIDSPNSNTATEFGAAAPFRDTLNYSPSPTTKVTPTAFTFLFGVTAYPPQGNAATLASLKTEGVNVAFSAAEGGLSNVALYWGTTKDGRDFTYWYSVDWVQINSQQALAAAIIEGSNSPANPLYYNQDGINRLQAVVAAVMTQGVGDGLVLGNVIQTALDESTFIAKVENGDYAGLTVVNAIPFLAYNEANPNDYALGKYTGLTVVYTPARGFTQIIFNVIVTDLVTGG